MIPLYERVLIKPKKKETKTSGGIMLPEKSVKRPNIGIVVAVGEGTPNNKMLVKPGDVVLCNRFAGVELQYKGETHHIVMANEIICIINNEADIVIDEFE